jgi:hypothetical protein
MNDHNANTFAGQDRPPKPLPRHDPLTCRRCESVSPDAWRRHWKAEPERRAWHVIADGLDLIARLPKSAHFITVLAYL